MLLFGALCGCGSGKPYDTVKVSGKVTYDDGSLIKADEISLTFEPQADPIDPKTSPKAGTAMVDVADGTFSCATTYEYGDGLIVGKHKVAVQPMKQGIAFTGPVPAAYLNATTSPLEVTVEPGSGPADLKLTVRKH